MAQAQAGIPVIFMAINMECFYGVYFNVQNFIANLPFAGNISHQSKWTGYGWHYLWGRRYNISAKFLQNFCTNPEQSGQSLTLILIRSISSRLSVPTFARWRRSCDLYSRISWALPHSYQVFWSGYSWKSLRPECGWRPGSTPRTCECGFWRG